MKYYKKILCAHANNSFTKPVTVIKIFDCMGCVQTLKYKLSH